MLVVENVWRFQAQTQSQFDALLAHHVPKSLRGNRREHHPLSPAGFVESQYSRSNVGVVPGQVIRMTIRVSSVS